MSDIRLAEGIYRTATGHRVYYRAPDPVTGRSKKVARRFGPNVPLELLIAYRERAQAVAGAPPENITEGSGFTADAKRYLALTKVKAMPSFRKREHEIETWMPIFGDTPRDEITGPMVSAALHDLRRKYSGSSCNKFRTALMSLWTTLDGRSAANPVKDADLFEETPMVPRGVDYDLLMRILDAVPDGRKARARLEVLAWTGMDPSTLARITMADVSISRRQYTPPLRQKGSRRSRVPRGATPLPMEFPETIAAFERLIAMKAIGPVPQPFNASALWQTWQAACRRVERQLRDEFDNPQFRLPHIRLKDLRHSFGTMLYERTGDLHTVAEMLQHAPGSAMTKRYALGAVPTVLRALIQRAAQDAPSRQKPRGSATVAPFRQVK